jgi:hypothetical protein
MKNFGELVSAVQRNCNISDARYASDHTLCVFLLKMRELYRWEHDIPFSGTMAKEDVGRWLEQRERLWEDLETSKFESLPLDSGPADPFDSDAVNRELLPLGYVYSGGYGRFNKPHFFLGKLERTEAHGNSTVLVSSCEYARDLDAPPAMLQGRTIYVRLESVRRYVWEKIEESQWSISREPMERALAGYGLRVPPETSAARDGQASVPDMDTALERVTGGESRAMILHELGELRAGELLGDTWNDMLLALSRSRAEIMARAVRDIVADLLVTLPQLVQTGNWPSLHFYFANFSGMRKHLYPELLDAYRRTAADRTMEPVRARIEQDMPRWLERARAMLALHRTGREQLECAIENLLGSGDAETRCPR